MDSRIAQQTGLPQTGALIVDVQPGSPAERAGLRRGEVVVELNHRPVKNRDDLMHGLSDAKPSSTVLLRVVAPGNEGRFLHALEIP